MSCVRQRPCLANAFPSEPRCPSMGLPAPYPPHTTRGALATGACRPDLPLVNGQHMEPSNPLLAWRRNGESPPPGLLPSHWRASPWPPRVSPNTTLQTRGTRLALSPLVSGVCPHHPCSYSQRGCWGKSTVMDFLAFFSGHEPRQAGSLSVFLCLSVSLSRPGPHGHSYT